MFLSLPSLHRTAASVCFLGSFEHHFRLSWKTKKTFFWNLGCGRYKAHAFLACLCINLNKAILSTAPFSQRYSVLFKTLDFSHIAQYQWLLQQRVLPDISSLVSNKCSISAWVPSTCSKFLCIISCIDTKTEQKILECKPFKESNLLLQPKWSSRLFKSTAIKVCGCNSAGADIHKTFASTLVASTFAWVFVTASNSFGFWRKK